MIYPFLGFNEQKIKPETFKVNNEVFVDVQTVYVSIWVVQYLKKDTNISSTRVKSQMSNDSDV